MEALALDADSFHWASLSLSKALVPLNLADIVTSYGSQREVLVPLSAFNHSSLVSDGCNFERFVSRDLFTVSTISKDLVASINGLGERADGENGLGLLGEKELNLQLDCWRMSFIRHFVQYHLSLH